MPCLHPGPEVEFRLHLFDQEEVPILNGPQESPGNSIFSSGILKLSEETTVVNCYQENKRWGSKPTMKEKCIFKWLSRLLIPINPTLTPFCKLLYLLVRESSHVPVCIHIQVHIWHATHVEVRE